MCREPEVSGWPRGEEYGFAAGRRRACPERAEDAMTRRHAGPDFPARRAMGPGIAGVGEHAAEIGEEGR